MTQQGGDVVDKEQGDGLIFNAKNNITTYDEPTQTLC
jgi:hypothetical protein